jgi:exodeoxyribonuclease VII large subunit
MKAFTSDPVTFQKTSVDVGKKAESRNMSESENMTSGSSPISSLPSHAASAASLAATGYTPMEVKAADTRVAAVDPHSPGPATAGQTSQSQPWQVSRVSQTFHDVVAHTWPPLWMDGQIQEINVRRIGSAYITLQDNLLENTIDVVGFGQFAHQARLFKQGDRVVVHGRADIWQKRTRLSFRADQIVRVGEGTLREQIEQLRRKLKGEGLFDEDRKVPLPEFPQCIGLICAPGARAEGDVKRNALLRWPTMKFAVEHVHVQGPECPKEVVAAIAKLDADPNVDVIIVARGGGSFEDLIGFSDESVVRAAAACTTPLISAIGHEDDWVLLDLAADLRASTPTDAAKRAVPDVGEQTQIIQTASDQLNRMINDKLTHEEQLVRGYLLHPSLTHPESVLTRPDMEMHQLKNQLSVAMTRLVDSAESDIARSIAQLTALSPQKTLDRGYSVIRDPQGHVVTSADSLAVGTDLELLLKSGQAHAQVTSISH